jgi:hypothetical protein
MGTRSPTWEELLADPATQTFDLEDRTYREEELSTALVSVQTLLWQESIDFANDKIRAAPDGGLIAVLHTTMSSSPGQIVLYDYRCVVRGTIKPRTPPIDFFVTIEEMIVLVDDTATLSLFDTRGNLISSRRLVEGAAIRLATFSEFGLFFLAGTIVYHVADYISAATVMGDIGASLSESLSFLVASPGPVVWGYAPSTGLQEILVCVQAGGLVQQANFGEEMRLLSFSSDYSCAAVLSYDSILLCSGDFGEAYVRINLNADLVRGITWCGTNAVLVTTNKKVVLIGRQDGQIREWDYPTGAVVAGEVDGARIIGKTSVRLLRPVPNAPDGGGAIVNFLKGRDCPGLLLFRTVTNLQNFAKADPIAALEEVLPQALTECLQVASFLRKREAVLALLAIVAKYKVHVRGYDTSLYCQVLQRHRLLSQLQTDPVDILVTAAELEHLTPNCLIMRLCNRYCHLHATRVADFLGLALEHEISVHWGHCLVRSRASPAEIVWKLSRAGSTLDYISLANAAFDLAAAEPDEAVKAQRRELALKLLAENKVKSGAVPVLIRREQWDEAIQTAIDSNDASLLTYVLDRAEQAGRLDVVQAQIAVSAVAFRAWSQLHGGAGELGPEILERAAASDRVPKAAKPALQKAARVERALRIVIGAPIDPSKDAAANNAIAKRAAIEQACGVLGQEYSPAVSPCDCVRAALRTRKADIVAKVSGLVEVKDVALLRCKLEHGFASKDPNYLANVAQNSANSALDVLIDFGREFIRRGKTDLAIAIRKGAAEKVNPSRLEELDAAIASKS